jgi:PIN domain nuclease of toxin-antitoxin system
LADAVVSTVNWSEYIQKAAARGLRVQPLSQRIEMTGLEIVDFTRVEAELAASLWPVARRIGASLADRACLATAIARSLPILTADRRWLELDLPVPVESIR